MNNLNYSDKQTEKQSNCLYETIGNIIKNKINLFANCIIDNKKYVFFIF